MPARSANRPYDLVLFGATGFTGGLTAAYLAAHAPRGLKWALAGRNRNKLETVRARLAENDARTASLPLLKVDAADAAAVAGIATSARVVISTVGPYIRYGEPLVAACAEAGTDYVDLTGEPEFVDAMWLKYHDAAVASGARLVHSCGFDSIPHDLGVWFTLRQLPDDVPLRVEGFVRTNGSFSAGTFHSAVEAFSRARGYAKISAQRRRREPRPSKRHVHALSARVHRDARVGSWVVPMPTIDPQVIRRSARALDRYGPDFAYAHYLQVKKLSSVASLGVGVAALFALAQFGPTRRWLLKHKTSGEGPSPEARARARFRVRFYGRAVGGTDGGQAACEVRGGDPGYDETAKMLAESALCLAFDDLPPCSGQVTSAQAMGDALIERLQRAGIVFEVVETTV